jgi:hypothetical protein
VLLLTPYSDANVANRTMSVWHTGATEKRGGRIRYTTTLPHLWCRRKGTTHTAEQSTPWVCAEQSSVRSPSTTHTSPQGESPSTSLRQSMQTLADVTAENERLKLVVRDMRAAMEALQQGLEAHVAAAGADGAAALETGGEGPAGESQCPCRATRRASQRGWGEQ